jgi:hypothetical protein
MLNNVLVVLLIVELWGFSFIGFVGFRVESPSALSRAKSRACGWHLQSCIALQKHAWAMLMTLLLPPCCCCCCRLCWFSL